MRRIFAFVVCLAMSLVTAGVANADPRFLPTRNQQAIDLVIARALSQRGVPFAYGGGTIAGPSLGNGSTSQVVDQSAAAVPGAIPVAGTPGSLPVVGLPGVTTVPGLTTVPVLPAQVQAPAPRVVGFDASGLMVYAFAGAGLKLPRSSGEQYLAAQKVLPSQALPGDLLFFGPNGSQSVALFLGGGQMLEVGDSVQVSPVRTKDMTPYLGRFIA